MLCSPLHSLGLLRASAEAGVSLWGSILSGGACCLVGVGSGWGEIRGSLMEEPVLHEVERVP